MDFITGGIILGAIIAAIKEIGGSDKGKDKDDDKDYDNSCNCSIDQN